MNNNRRYLRFSGAAHPSWLGYQDRHLFPPYEDDPSYFFIRKFNSVGNNFEEAKLIKWIEKFHYEDGPTPECNIQMMSVRKECLQQLGKDIAYNNQLIVVPVNVPFWKYAQNLQCSFSRLGIKNYVFWALDLEIYETLLSAGHMAVYLPGVDPSPLLALPETPALVSIMRAKTKILQMFVGAGFDIWYLDSDTVAVNDFRNIVPTGIDAMVALEDIDYMKKGRSFARPSAGIMFFRSSKKGEELINLYIQSLESSMLLDDQNAFKRVLNKAEMVKILMPNETLNEQDQSKIKPIVQYLDPFSFINSNVFISSPQSIPVGFKDYFIVHTKSKRDHIDTLQSLGYWYLDDNMKCRQSTYRPKAAAKQERGLNKTVIQQ